MLSQLYRHAPSLLCQAFPALGGFSGIQFRKFQTDFHDYDLYTLQNLFQLQNQVALVTGCGAGIGKAACLALAQAGADVVISDIDPEHSECHQVEASIKQIGRQALNLKLDVRDRLSVNGAMDKVRQQFGKLNILVCNAGILGEMQQPQDMKEENWDNVLGVNLYGARHCARAAYPLLKEAGAGKVIFMSSIAARYGSGPQSAYCASKGALLPLAKSLAIAWAKDNIQVNCILPGPIGTSFVNPVLSDEERRKYIIDRIPAGRLGTPADVVGAILYFSSASSNFVSGTELVIDGGGTARAMAQ
eukprot:TRINITY_DN10120_c0_g1_i1.p1 TRINITY_DN10120_c0_g1~~TRINITY_DN10120_c0_g1_i1.p1  ORF type:complete len:303 (-),score=40.69 TRINITY_DN10120_c0_g1_i1:446-1354(-)